MNKFVELAHKLYNEKRKLELTYTGIKLVGVIEGKAYWYVGTEKYKTKDIVTGEFYDVTLTMEQIKELGEDDFQDLLKDEFYPLDFAKTLIENGVLLSLEILDYKNKEDYLSYLLNENVWCRVKTYLEQESATIICKRIEELKDVVKELAEQKIEEGKFDEISNLVVMFNKVVFLNVIHQGVVDEVKSFGENLITELAKAKEFEYIVYTSNELCIALQKLDRKMFKKDGKYQYYTDIMKMGEMY
ncbi:hypothetical protein [Bacillus toyonensis]|uniref:hypothetical protein n=1 Tax=Bacillus toyonensis TaxID=155322 RepID=UPI000BF375D0|nr:hypothetical protein [Bacillus toyonensis]PGF05036.1 hypothetical protein COM61_00960 [Bacillus toyonensis]